MVALISAITWCNTENQSCVRFHRFKKNKVRGKSQKPPLCSPLTDYLPAAYQQSQLLSHIFIICYFLWWSPCKYVLSLFINLYGSKNRIQGSCGHFCPLVRSQLSYTFLYKVLTFPDCPLEGNQLLFSCNWLSPLSQLRCTMLRYTKLSIHPILISNEIFEIEVETRKGRCNLVHVKMRQSCYQLDCTGKCTLILPGHI